MFLSKRGGDGSKCFLRLLSSIALIILSLPGWVIIDAPFRGNVDTRVFTLYEELFGLSSFTLGITVGGLLGDSWEMVIMYVTGFLPFVFFASLVLLTLSIVKYQTDKGKTFAYYGFALSAFVPAVFITLMLIVSASAGGGIVRITVIPVLSLILSIIAMKFFTKSLNLNKD